MRPAILNFTFRFDGSKKFLKVNLKRKASLNVRCGTNQTTVMWKTICLVHMKTLRDERLHKSCMLVAKNSLVRSFLSEVFSISPWIFRIKTNGSLLWVFYGDESFGIQLFRENYETCLSAYLFRTTTKQKNTWCLMLLLLFL